jgi:hypothetical protein
MSKTILTSAAYKKQGLFSPGIFVFTDIFSRRKGSIETHMNGSSHPKHENRINEVPHLRASPRHNGAMRFIQFDFA